MKTIQSRPWHLLDAQELPLGRLAVKISNLLCGKGKVTYQPNIDGGDAVVVVNAANFITTGNKELKKIYYRYSGYPGGLKEETLGKLKKRKPDEVIRKAVYGMLPKNKLAAPRMARLYIYPTSDHPHSAQLSGGQK